MHPRGRENDKVGFCWFGGVGGEGDYYTWLFSQWANSEGISQALFAPLHSVVLPELGVLTREKAKAASSIQRQTGCRLNHRLALRLGSH